MTKNKASWAEHHNDELIIFGSGGGRFHTVSQFLSTGGILLRIKNSLYQIHLDPGPGAIRDYKKYGINPRGTTHTFLTHHHTDHSMSIPILIEAMQEDFKYGNKRGVLVAPNEYLMKGSLDHYYQDLLHQIIPVSEKEIHLLNPDISFRTTHTHHGAVENVGYVFTIQDHDLPLYSVGFTSDTAAFPGYSDEFANVDVLVANVLRPSYEKCRGHLSIQEFIPLLQEIQPKICILTHFGSRMVHPDNGNLLQEQINAIRQKVNSSISVIPATDGLSLFLHSYLQ